MYTYGHLVCQGLTYLLNFSVSDSMDLYFFLGFQTYL